MIGVTSYSINASFRKTQWSKNAEDWSNSLIKIQSSANEPNFLLPDNVTVERAANLSVAEQWRVRVAHSTNGYDFSPWSNELVFTYPDASGSGGSGGGSQPLPPTNVGDNPPPPTTGSGCFAGDTHFNLSLDERITFAELYRRRAEFIGKEVLSFDANNNYTKRKIVAIFRVKSNCFLIAKFKNGKRRKCTPTHRFWTESRAFVSICELQAGDKVYDKYWNSVEIESIEIKTVKRPQWFYNATIEIDHAYFVEFPVSNIKPPRLDNEY